MKKQIKKLSLSKTTIANLNGKIKAVQTNKIVGGLNSAIGETKFENCVTVFCTDDRI